MIEEITGMKDIITITEIEVDQEKGISQEITITAEVEVQAIVDQDQGLEPVQIEIEEDVMHIENMTILQETVPIPERRTIWNNCNKC